jgi:hypothetical protein
MSAAIKNYASSNLENINSPDNDVVNSIIESEVDSPQESTQLINDMSADELRIFKEKVKNWIELDMVIKRLQMAIKERKKLKDSLNSDILRFMIKYSIEDLNTKTGTIKYKKTKTKVPLSQKKIKDKLFEVFQNNEKIIKKIDEIFNDREIKEKDSLKKTNFT